MNELITGLKPDISSKSLKSAPSVLLTDNERKFLKRFPTLDNVFEAFGPNNWKYALEHVDKAVKVVAPSMNRLNIIYKTIDADVTLFLKHLVSYYLLVERSGKELSKDTCMGAAAIFLGNNGFECTPVKLLCYFANYPYLKESYREFDPEDIIVQYNKRFIEWWGIQMTKFCYKTETHLTDDKEPCGLEAIKLTIRRWIEQGEDPRHHALFKMSRYVSDDMIAEVEREIAIWKCSSCEKK